MPMSGALIDAGTHRRLLDAWRLSVRRQRSRLYGRRGRKRRLQPKLINPKSSGRNAKAIGCVTAVDELNKLSPQAGEETALAERRTAMMQAEKVARTCKMRTRRRRRQFQRACAGDPEARGGARQAPGLVEPTVKALDAALAALDETRSQLEAALRTADFDPAELERIEERVARAARGTQIQCAGRRAVRAGST